MRIRRQLHLAVTSLVCKRWAGLLLWWLKAHEAVKG
jgi:hypothetical protein